MINYKTIDTCTYDDCVVHIHNSEMGKGDPDADVLKRYERLEEELRKSDDDLYGGCKDSIEGCDKYLSSFPRPGAHAYKPRHIDEVRRIKSRLQEEQKKRREEARQQMKKAARGVAAVVFLVYTMLNADIATKLEVSDYEEAFGMGDTLLIPFETDAPIGNGELRCYDAQGLPVPSWVNARLDEANKVIVAVVGGNYSDARDAVLRLEVASRVFGKRVCTISRDIRLHQLSGAPTRVEVSRSVFRFDQWGDPLGESRFEINTDGVLRVDFDSAKWCLLREEDTGYSIRVLPNWAGGERQAAYSFGEGALRKTVRVYQKSGLASKFEVGTEFLLVDEGGTRKGYGYSVGVETDGVTWSVVSYPDWLVCDKYDKTVFLQVGATKEARAGDVVLRSNNGHTRKIRVAQKGDPTELYFDYNNIDYDDLRWQVSETAGQRNVRVTNNGYKRMDVTTSDRTWLTATFTSDNNLNLRWGANNWGPRYGRVYVRCGSKSIVLRVAQDGLHSCTTCDGNGWWPCGGGWYQNGVKTHMLLLDWNLQPKWQYCSLCGGSGKIRCIICEGAGKLKDAAYEFR